MSVASVLIIGAWHGGGGVTWAAGPAAAPSDAPSIELLGAQPTTPIDRATADRLQAVLDSEVKYFKPDIIATVMTPAGIWSGAAGISGPDGRLATTADVGAIASVSKLFQAALVMRLAEQGRIDLDQPLGDYLVGIDVDTNGATVRQALGMRSGIGASLPGASEQIAADCGHAWTRDEVIATFPEPVASPGIREEYSNPTYKMLGWAVEAVTGSSLAAALKSEVIDPAGIGDRITLQGMGTPTPQPWALPIAGHNGSIDLEHFGEGDALPCLANATLALGAAGMAADMPSLARWGWELFAGRIVSPDSLAQMVPGPDGGYGLGMEEWAFDFGGIPTYGHSGVNDGYKAILAYQPSSQAIVALLINDGDVDEISSARQLLMALEPPK